MTMIDVRHDVAEQMLNERFGGDSHMFVVDLMNAIDHAKDKEIDRLRKLVNDTVVSA